MKEYGIEETKDVLEFGLSFGSALGNALEDGFQFTDLIGILPTFIKFPAAMEGIEQIPKELKELDAAERQELADFVAEKFNVPGDKIEGVIERTVQFGLDTANYVLFMKDNV